MSYLKKGFTLLEISVVLLIITLIAGGISLVNSLIQQAKLQATMMELNYLHSAAQSFRLKYNYLPGDIKNASSFWPTANNGNGDGVIGDGAAVMRLTEVLWSWNHMSLANMVGSYYTGVAVGATAWVPGINMPSAKIPGGVYCMNYWGYNFYNQTYYRTFLVLARLGNADYPWSISALTPLDTKSIDLKMDDGIPSSGDIIALAGDEQGSGYCTSTNWTQPGPASYVLTDLNISCRIFYNIKN